MREGARTIRIRTLRGNPCRSEYVELPLAFGADAAARAATLARYPSGESQPAADAAAVEESVS